jgi:flagellar hook-length control protein FliK
MPASTANSLLPPIVPDWPAGSRAVAPWTPEPDASFDALLQPATAAESPPTAEDSPPTTEDSPPKAEDSPPKADASEPEPQAVADSPEYGPEAGPVEDIAVAAEQLADTDKTQETPTDAGLPSDVVQSLSGAAAINAIPLAPVVTASGEAALELDAVEEGEPSAAGQTTAAGQPFGVEPGPVALTPVGSTPLATVTSRGTIVQLSEASALSPTGQQVAEDAAPPVDADLEIATGKTEEPKSSVEVQPNPSATSAADAKSAEPAKVDAAPVSAVPPSTAASDAPSPAAPQPGILPAGATRIAVPAEMRPADSSHAAPTAPDIEIDSARLLHRVARAFASAAEQHGPVTIRLSPPELGLLRLEARVEDGLLTARLQAETPEAQAVILENLSSLRERLADQGVRIERFDVELMNRQSGQSSREPFDQPREMPRPPRANVVRHPVPQPAPDHSPKTLQATSGRLNVIV